jgi:hypothetical protein
MIVDSYPLRYQWFSLSIFIFRNKNEIVLKKNSPPSIVIILGFLVLGMFLILMVSISESSDPKIIGYLFAMMFLFVSYMGIHVFIFDQTTFDGRKKKLFLKRGIFSGSIEKNVYFNDIKMFQIIEYVSTFHDEWQSDSGTKTYQLNVVFSNNERLHLINSYSKNKFLTEVKKLKSFTERPIKVVRLGKTVAY